MIDVLLVTSTACHLCEDAQAALEELGREFPLSIRVTSIETDEGREVLRRFRPPLPPFVLVEGDLFSSGRLPRKKLRRYLERTRVVV